jgi:hypothetical protein
MKYSNPVAAAKAARAERKYWMGYARRARTREDRSECVAVARTFNHDLVRALRQVAQS